MAALRMMLVPLTSSSSGEARSGRYSLNTFFTRTKRTAIAFWCSKPGPLLCLSTFKILLCLDSTRRARPLSPNSGRVVRTASRATKCGLPWHSDHKFPGLAYNLGGRSLFWGGWSPQLLDSEMPLDRWPANVVYDLNRRYFREASEQLGAHVTNDFIFSRLHEPLPQTSFEVITAAGVAS